MNGKKCENFAHMSNSIDTKMMLKKAFHSVKYIDMTFNANVFDVQ